MGRSDRIEPASCAGATVGDVVDRISVMLGGEPRRGRASADPTKARRLADDAYWGEFEASDMETAVREVPGLRRTGELERQFRAIANGRRAKSARNARARVGAGRIDAIA